MAGTNGKDKWLKVNRNDEIENIKIRGNVFQFLPDQIILAGTAQITGTQWVDAQITLSAGQGTINGPSTADLVQQLSQQGLFVQGEAVHMILANADPVNPVTINLGASWNPTSITLQPNSQYEIVYKIATNPVGFEIDQVIPLGSVNPALNANPAPSNFGSSFSLTPSVAYDVIVKNAANTLWVPSGTTNGGHMPFLILRGTVASPTNDMLRIDDIGGLNTYTNFADVRQTQDAALATTNFHLFNGVSQAPNFGNRGVGLTDTIYRSQITATPATPNGYHARFGTQGVDVFYVKSNGVTKIVLGAGPPVTNLAINAAGEICAAASSVTVKENIVNANTTDFIYNFVPREFNYIGDNIKQVGAVVEELQPLIPDPLKPAIIDYAITSYAYTDANGVFHPMVRNLSQPQSINSQGMIFCMLKELQKLKAEFDAYVAAHP